MTDKKKIFSKRALLVIIDLVLIAFNLIFSFLLKTDITYISKLPFDVLWSLFMVFTPLYFVVSILYGVYKTKLKYASLDLVYKFVKCIIVPVVAVIVFARFVPILQEVNLSLLIIFSLLLFISLVFSRFAIRIISDVFTKTENATNVLIYGAGDAGSKLARVIIEDKTLGYNLCGFLDRDPAKKGLLIHNKRVFGDHRALNKCVRKFDIKLLIFAIPSIEGRRVREIIKGQNDIEYKIIPDINELISGKVTINQLRDVEVKDLLKRPQRELSFDKIKELIFQKTVLVSGAGGSIGSELCNQILKRNPKKIVLLEFCEFNLFKVEMELKKRYENVEIVPELKNIVKTHELEACFAEHKPDIVFHAAAYKHVTMVENNPFSAISNNVFGTMKLIQTADKYGVGKFIQISTDKAVNPSNVMGCTKRLCEIYCRYHNNHSDMQISAVRFGNVLGSSGSVIPIFKKQIASGGPVTVTHPDVTRYFMLISEAAQLILQAAQLGDGGEIFVLDMGEPVKIRELAEDMIQLIAPGKSIEVVYSGLKRGEKLDEKLIIDHTRMKKVNNFIMVENPESIDSDETKRLYDKLYKVAVEEKNFEDTIKVMKEIEPNFVYNY
jgi:FlaA1/EpsC-like NDP-sugar epimerase